VRVNNHNNFSGSRGILGSSGNPRDQQPCAIRDEGNPGQSRDEPAKRQRFLHKYQDSKRGDPKKGHHAADEKQRR